MRPATDPNSGSFCQFRAGPAILTVELHAEPGSTSKIQFGLFSPQLPEPGRLDVTLARIAALVGEGNVGQAVLDDTHTPEGFHVEPFQVSSGTAEPVSSPSRVCLRQLRPPLLISMALENGRPRSFFFREQRCTVERAYGPWLTGGEWWNETIWGQEQWDLIVRTQSSALLFCCTVRDLVRDQWQVVSLYDRMLCRAARLQRLFLSGRRLAARDPSTTGL